MMMVSLRSRPNWERSCDSRQHPKLNREEATYLDVVSLVVETALAEQSMVNNVMDIQLIQKGIAILISR